MKSIPQLFEECTGRFEKNILLWEKTAAQYEGTTYAEVKNLVYHFAAGLLQMGLKKGDRAALLSEGRNAWFISELGILYAGAVNVPVSTKINEPDDLAFRLNHSGCRFVIVSRNQSDKIRAIRKYLTSVERIIHLDTPEKKEANEITYDEILSAGKTFLEQYADVFEKTWRSVQESDHANICYTSGTTSNPKGVILTHRNYTANVEQACGLMSIPQHYRILLFLPWDHSFAHTAGLYSFMNMGASIASVQIGKNPMETIKNFSVNMKEIKPHILLSVPAIAKNFKKNIETGIKQKGHFIEKLFHKALTLAYSYYTNGYEPASMMQKMKWTLLKIYDRIIFSKIRRQFGGNLQFFIGGGAYLDMDLQKFFYSIGIPMFQGYGLTEASPVISSNAPQCHKLGTSGLLVKNLELKIRLENGNEATSGEMGEIVIRGENVMAGYWMNEKATNEVLRDGWLHTGDMGYLDEDGFLCVIGRFKSLLIGNDGEKYSPEAIEESIPFLSPIIEQCMLYNNQNSYTVGLIVPNKEIIQELLSKQNLSIETQEGREVVLNLIRKEINEYKKGGKYEGMFPERWLPATIAILPESFNEKNRLLNSTLKMVRNKIVEQYKEKIEFLYQPEGKNILNDENIKALEDFNKN